MIVRANAARLAQAARGDYESAMRQLRSLAQPYREIEIPMVSPTAAQWFEDNGIPYQLEGE